MCSIPPTYLEQCTQYVPRLAQPHELPWHPQPHNVAHKGEAGGLVEGGPQLDAWAKALEHRNTVVNKQGDVRVLQA